MAAVDVTVQTEIARPLSEVAAFAGDPSNATEWYVNIKSAVWRTPAPMEIGSLIDFTAHFMGKKLSYTYEIVELVPNRRLVMRTQQGPFPMETTYTWEPTRDGTLMKLRNHGEPSGFMSIAGVLMERAMRKATSKDLAKLKALLERSASSVPES